MEISSLTLPQNGGVAKAFKSLFRQRSLTPQIDSQCIDQAIDISLPGRVVGIQPMAGGKMQPHGAGRVEVLDAEGDDGFFLGNGIIDFIQHTFGLVRIAGEDQAERSCIHGWLR